MIHPRTSILSSSHSILLRADNHHIKKTDLPQQTSNLSHSSSVSDKVIMASAAPAMLKRWAKSLRLNEDDVKLLHESSKLTNPVGFLMFLSKVSKNKDAFALTVEQLQGIKEEIMTQKVDIPDNQTLCPTKKSERLSCSLSLACNSNDESSNLPRQFDPNKKIKKQVKKPVKSHHNKMISSFKRDINNLWDRRFPQDQSNIARSIFIPNEFLEKDSDVPNDCKKYLRIVQQVISSSQRVSQDISMPENESICMKTLQWAHRLINVWELDDPEKMVTQKLWKDMVWQDILAAPLFQQGSDSNSMWFKFRQDLEGSSSTPSIQSFLNKFDPLKTKNIQMTEAQKANLNARTISQKKTLKKFLNSPQDCMATFFTSKVLGLTGPQSAVMVKKNSLLVGNLFEKDVFQTLKAVAPMDSAWITVFSGLEVLGSKQGQQEFDFLIFCGEEKKIIYVECKYSSSLQNLKKIKKQSDNAFKYLQKHLPLTENWEFVTLACFGDNMNFSPCLSCLPFVVQTSNLGTILDDILSGSNHIENKISKKDYTDLIETVIFHAQVNKQVCTGDEAAKHQLKTGAFSDQSRKLWNMDHLSILQQDPLRMTVKSSDCLRTGPNKIQHTNVNKQASYEKNCGALLLSTRKPLARNQCAGIHTYVPRLFLTGLRTITHKGGLGAFIATGQRKPWSNLGVSIINQLMSKASRQVLAGGKLLPHRSQGTSPPKQR